MSEEPKSFDEVVKPYIDPKDKREQELKDSVEGQFRVTETSAFKKFRQDLSDNQIAEIRRLAPQRSFEINVNGELKTFTRSKIKTKDYVVCEKIRAQLLRERDVNNATDLQFELYAMWAKFYLGMSQDDFDNSDFETLKKVLDTCNIVTVQGIPNGT